jgi:hypothetical protein
MSRTEREKGKRGEREAAKKLTRMLGVPVTRTQQFKGTPISADLEGVDGLHIEIKRRERLNFNKALEQAWKEAGDDRAIVFTRKNQKAWVAICYMDDLIDIAKILLDTLDANKP